MDGQQRVTTLYMILMAAAELAGKNGDLEWAAETIETYLVRRPIAGNPVNTKLVPGYADRAQFASIWKRFVEVPGLYEQKSMDYNPPVPPAPSGLPTGEMTEQYVRIFSALSMMFDAGGADALHRLVDVIAGHLSFITITLRDPTVAPKIFERLNARAEPITVADLVRNEVFSRSGDDVTSAQHVFNTHWEPFNSSFKEAGTDLEKFLFPYGLLSNSNVRKADLFPHIRTTWAPLGSPQNIIADMNRFKDTFLAVESGLAHPRLSSNMNEKLWRIHKVGRPSVTYSFIMRLVEAYFCGEVSEGHAAETLAALESFLFRRALMGIEPTGLHAAFKGLWNDLIEGAGAEGINAITFRDRLSSKPTIRWPSDFEFTEAVKSEALYKRKIKAYALGEHERSLRGETASDPSVIEHVAPQSSTEYWRSRMGEPYGRLIHTWGNLIPLSDKMNPRVGQKPFSEKRAEFALSKFANARQIAADYSDWDAEIVQARNALIASWAVKRWPY